MKVLISDSLSDEGVELFNKTDGLDVTFDPKITPEDLLATIDQYDALVVRSRSKVPREVIERGSNLRVIGRAGVGVDNIDVEAATDCGIIVMNTPSGNNMSTAEHSIAMLMSLARKIPFAHASMAGGKWDKKAFTGVEVCGKTAGIVGVGRIGSIVAKRLTGLGMRVIGYDPFLDPDMMKPLGVEAVDLDTLIEQSDFITIHAPLVDSTKNLLGKEAFKKMKKGVLIVNCARGGIVNEEELAEALKEGVVGGAAFDVYTTEPLPEDHALRSAPNMVLTPHVAASTVEAQENVAIEIAHQVIDALLGKEVRNAINMPSVDPEIWKSLKPYMTLGEKLGRFAAQFSKERIEKMTVRYSGDVVNYPIQPVTTSIAKGFLEPTTDESINFVNALKKLDRRGVAVVSETHTKTYNYTNLVTVVTSHADGSENSFSGTLFTKERPRLVILNDKHFDAYLEGNMVIIENNDVPGVIGAVGTLFGEHGINIGQMTWGRTEHNQEAMTVVNIDQEVSPEFLAAIEGLENIKTARLIRM